MNDRNLALQLAKADWGKSELKRSESTHKNQSKNEKNEPKKTEFAMK